MATADVNIFAANLRHLMNKRDLTEVELALELRIDRARIQAWRGGRCFPQEDILIKLCEYFKYYDIFKLFTEKIKL